MPILSRAADAVCMGTVFTCLALVVTEVVFGFPMQGRLSVCHHLTLLVPELGKGMMSP